MTARRSRGRLLTTHSTVMAGMLAGAMLLSGCSSSSSMSCDDYTMNSSDERVKIVFDMVSEHGLDPTSNPIAVAMVVDNVDSFCGLMGSLDGGPATQHQSSSIEDGVDWAGITAEE